MSWPIRMVQAPTMEVGPDGLNGFQRLRAGDAWFVGPRDYDDYFVQLVAPEHTGKRPAIVRLPGPVDFAVYGPTWRDGKPGPSGWKVEGELPLVTLTPSINVQGVYHGYIQNGVITDDVEGRKFNVDGRRAQG